MIELRGVSKTVSSGGQPLTILHPLDLHVQAGQRLAIVGPSGSGKSTLLGLMAGLDAPTSGEILIDGTDITAAGRGRAGAAARPRRSGSSSSSSIWFRRSPRSRTCSCRWRSPARRGAAARARRCSTRSGLSDRGHHYPSQLSGGEQQRVAIARALSNEPPMLLADEPTGNLDSSNGQHVIDLLFDVQPRGTTLVLVTHDRRAGGAGRRPAVAARRPVSKTVGEGRRPAVPVPLARRWHGARWKVRPAHGRPRDARRVAPAALLLRLHRHRRRRDRGDPFGHRPGRGVARPRGAGDDRGRRGRRPTARGTPRRSPTSTCDCRRSSGWQRRARSSRRDDGAPAGRSGRRSRGWRSSRPSGRGYPLYGAFVLRGGQPYSTHLLAGHGVLCGPICWRSSTCASATGDDRPADVRHPRRDRDRAGAAGRDVPLGPRVIIDRGRSGLDRPPRLRQPGRLPDPAANAWTTAQNDRSSSSLRSRSATASRRSAPTATPRGASAASSTRRELPGPGRLRDRRARRHRAWSVTRVFLQKRTRIAVLKCLGASSGRILSALRRCRRSCSASREACSGSVARRRPCRFVPSDAFVRSASQLRPDRSAASAGGRASARWCRCSSRSCRCRNPARQAAVAAPRRDGVVAGSQPGRTGWGLKPHRPVQRWRRGGRQHGALAVLAALAGGVVAGRRLRLGRLRRGGRRPLRGWRGVRPRGPAAARARGFRSATPCSASAGPATRRASSWWPSASAASSSSACAWSSGRCGATLARPAARCAGPVPRRRPGRSARRRPGAARSRGRRRAGWPVCRARVAGVSGRTSTSDSVEAVRGRGGLSASSR